MNEVVVGRRSRLLLFEHVERKKINGWIYLSRCIHMKMEVRPNEGALVKACFEVAWSVIK